MPLTVFVPRAVTVPVSSVCAPKQSVFTTVGIEKFDVHPEPSDQVALPPPSPRLPLSTGLACTAALPKPHVVSSSKKSASRPNRLAVIRAAPCETLSSREGQAKSRGCLRSSTHSQDFKNVADS